MKNPLRKRLPRELRSEAGKYFVIFLLMLLSIGFVSGFLVADSSMIIAYQESFTKYNVEDGDFRLSSKINRAQKKAVEAAGVTLYENFYVEENLPNGSTLRIFQNRQAVNLACLMEGSFPNGTGEIAIDRMYAENNGIGIGDVLTSERRSWKVTGLVALPDYSCLFADNSDSMFDAVKFGVSVVSAEEFAAFTEDELHYSYCWKYDTPPVNETEEKEASDDLIECLSSEVPLEDFVPRYLNQAIQFTGEDMSSDRGMMIALLYIIIVIMAFVLGVTISNTIAAEANVIGTLRASGYTKGELIRHYMAMPMLVTLLGALLGNILGYTVFKDICVGMYYNSYSLPTYTTVWNGEAFFLTTVIPVFLMVCINFFVLHHKLGLTPLQFLHRDISGKRQKRAFPLNHHIPFFSRFRLRVIFQNRSNYIVLFVGILFANLLLMFGLLMPSVLEHYQQEIEHNLLANYQYILSMPAGTIDEDRKLESLISMLYFQSEVETENENAEQFSAYSLKTLEGEYKSEEVLLYGVEENSRYISIPSGDGVYLSSAYSDKYLIEPGDTIVLKEAYEDTTYSFRVAGVYDYSGALAVFMDQETLNRTFDLGDGYFSGYLSDTEITDIDRKYIGSVIDLEALTKISRQLDVSMGSMMTLVDGFAVLIFLVLIYLLSKTIIEKNSQSISMAKILGYTNLEISRLYIISTSVMVVLFLILSLPIDQWVMKLLFRWIVMTEMTGWIPFYVDPQIYVQMVLMGMVTYGVVAALEYRRVCRVPMDEALKNLIDDLKQLSDASQALVEGTQALYDGADEFSGYLSEYVKGVDVVDQGAAALAEGLKELNDNRQALEQGAAGLEQALTQVNDTLQGGLSDLKEWSENGELADSEQQALINAVKALVDDAQALYAQLDSLYQDLDELSSFSDDVKAYLTAVETAAETARDILSSIDLEQLESDANARAKTQVEKAISEALRDTALTEEEKNAILEKVSGSIDLSGAMDPVQEKLDALQSVISGLPELEIPEVSVNVGSINSLIDDMESQLAVLNDYGAELFGTVEGLSDLSGLLKTLCDGSQQLQDGSTQLKEGISAFSEGIGALYSGADQLSGGTHELKSAGNALTKGFDALVDGCKELNEGFITFDEEGIQRLSDLAGDDLRTIITRFKALQAADAVYQNFGGLRDGQTGSVKFIVETGEISSDDVN